MFCAHVIRLSIPAVMLTIAAAGPAPAQEAVLQIYDLRDLVAEMPPDLPAEPPRPLLFQVLETPPAPPPPIRGGADRLMEAVCSALSAECDRIAAGIYAVSASPDVQHQVAEVLERTRSLYTDRYEVSIQVTRAPAGATPEIGKSTAAAEVLSTHRIVAVRRQPAALIAQTDVALLANVIPSVAQNAFALSGQMETASAGLALSVTVGAGPETDGGTNLRVTGQWTHVKLDRRSGPFDSRDQQPLTIDLPTVQHRSVQSYVRVAAGEATVIAAVPDFEDAGQTLVLVATVRKLAP